MDSFRAGDNVMVIIREKFLTHKRHMDDTFPVIVVPETRLTLCGARSCHLAEPE
jgi:hypothetical protein